MKQFDTDTDEMEKSEDYKPTYIHEQHNNNCQQFFGPITNCTFTMPAPQPSSSKKPKATKQKNAGERKSSVKPKTLKYFTHGNNGVLMEQRKRVDIIFKKFSEWGWVDANTSPNDFDAFFEGVPRHCNINWTGSSTILTILLQELLKQSYIEKQTGCAAKSLVEQQFGRTANSDRTRLDGDAHEKIELTLLILDTKNPLPERRRCSGSDPTDIKDAALREIFSGKLRSTKGI